jgi:hypothetical protein
MTARGQKTRYLRSPDDVAGIAGADSRTVAFRLALFIMRSRLNPIPDDQRPEVLQAGR